MAAFCPALQLLVGILLGASYGNTVCTVEIGEDECRNHVDADQTISLIQQRAKKFTEAYSCKILSRHEEIWETVPGGKFKPKHRDGIVVSELPQDCHPRQDSYPIAELQQLNVHRFNRSTFRLPLIPYPKFLKRTKTNPFLISESTPLVFGPEIAENDLIIQVLRKHIAETTRHSTKRHPNRGKIVFELDPSVEQDREGYHLTVSSDKVELRAPSETGLFYAVQTLKQLTNQKRAELPAVIIKDAPRFQWRGLHLDVSRHFFGAAEVKQLLNTMAAFKFNVFHWHLTDDQGWRIPIEGYPLLTELGAESMTNNSEFYTTAEIKDVIKYAQERHIEILPEVDVPGHAQAAIAAYPDLGNVDIPNWVPPKHPAKTLGVQPFTMSLSNTTFTALDSILTQVSKLFPSSFVHIGGDEAPTEQWDKSPRAHSSMQQKKATHAQSIFTEKLGEILRKEGKTAVVWDEAQHLDGLSPDAVIMAWRSGQEVDRALASGRRVINADMNNFYFDHYQGNSKEEPKAICCFLPLQQVYNHDPMPTGISKDKQALVLGAQAELWSEFFPTWKHVEYMAFPRALALTERLWTPNHMISGFHEFRTRLEARLPDLDAMGVNYRKLTD